MPNLLRPGVYVTEAASGSNANPNPTITQFAFVGPHGQGPVVPTLVTGWQQFQSLYGGFVPVGDSSAVGPTNLALAVYNFFTNGGGSCIVVRVVHTTGTTPYSTTSMSQLVSSGAVAVVQVSAVNPGIWGQSIYVAVVAATDGNSADFSLVVYYGGSASSNIVERWSNLSMSQGSSRYFVSVINSANNVAGSAYITVSDLTGTPSVPGATPAVVAALQLSTLTNGVTGADGIAPQQSETVTAINLLNTNLSPLVINLPGMDNTAFSTAVGGAFTFAGLRSPLDTFVMVDPPLAGVSVSTITTTSLPTATSYGAIYYPNVQVSDPTSSVPGANRICSPCAAVMGAMAAVDNNIGPWQSVAGQTYGGLPSVNGLQYYGTPTDYDTLNVANVNAIRQVPGSGRIAVYGGRTLSPLQQSLYINVRRTLILIEATIRNLLQSYVFAPDDTVTWQAVESQVSVFLTAIWASGGLVGNQASDAFYVVCDDTINTPTTIAAGQLVVNVGVAPVTPAEFIVVNVAQWANGTSTVTESLATSA